MSAATAGATDVGVYVDAVRARLGHLPAEERADLIDDLREHLAEAAADAAAADEPLAERLGTPDAYAEEFLASAGIEPGPDGEPERRPRWAQLTESEVVQRWRRRGRRLAERPAVRATTAFLPELRPAWWVVRGYLVVALLPLLADVDGAARSFPFPRVFGSALLGTLLAAIAIPVSVRLGRRSATDPRHCRRRLEVLHGLLAVGLLAAVVAVRPDAWALPGAYADEGAFEKSFGGRGASLMAADGRPITNIYPYDSDGNLLHNVLLYDQDGQPVANTADVDEDGSLTAQAPLDANGAPVDHAYPLQRHRCVWTQNGGLIPFGDPLPPPAVVVPRLAEPTATVPSSPSAPSTTTTPATTAPPTTASAGTPTTLSPPTTTDPAAQPTGGPATTAVAPSASTGTSAPMTTVAAGPPTTAAPVDRTGC